MAHYLHQLFISEIAPETSLTWITSTRYEKVPVFHPIPSTVGKNKTKQKQQLSGIKHTIKYRFVLFLYSAHYFIVNILLHNTVMLQH